ncbi:MULTISPECIES: PolC-type DNA polymerase III [unclassified Meiothermus]|uniref:3'-5' exonuclease n=1 Tax=unclassified Meiothermus TaxID=370471 RepID=UPI000D7CE21E|nr:MULTISPECIES: 3'-5' exonuclease [unclassified Meiothermus]PZA06525.1 DNA polymerase III subunit epsilon [Meiothermus sp. Pnk-1]RYM37200.1 3'-5' exonuclease [Meiothermus sp. PNK-Is4]
MSPTHYRLATRIARRLRQEGHALPKARLAEEVLASQNMPQGPWAARLLEDLLDGRFEQRPQEVGLWEWRNPFPPPGKPVVVLDLETTGLSALENEIIEIALIRLEGEKRQVFQRLVNPGTPLPPFIRRLTGITPRDLEGAPDVYTALEEALPLIKDSVLIIQNAPFDLGFLRPRLLRLGYKMDNEVIDTVAWARRALPGLPKRGLDHLAWAFDLDTAASRHRALGDVEITLWVAKEMYYMLTAGKPLALGDV